MAQRNLGADGLPGSGSSSLIRGRGSVQRAMSGWGGGLRDGCPPQGHPTAAPGDAPRSPPQRPPGGCGGPGLQVSVAFGPSPGEKPVRGSGFGSTPGDRVDVPHHQLAGFAPSPPAVGQGCLLGRTHCAPRRSRESLLLRAQPEKAGLLRLRARVRASEHLAAGSQGSVVHVARWPYCRTPPRLRPAPRASA